VSALVDTHLLPSPALGIRVALGPRYGRFSFDVVGASVLSQAQTFAGRSSGSASYGFYALGVAIGAELRPTFDPQSFILRDKAAVTNVRVTVPGVNASSRVLGTELGLMWFSPLSDADVKAGLTGPLAVSFCAEAALATQTCLPKVTSLDLDEVIRVKDEAPYLYVFGRRALQYVVIRWLP
jgi:hypothetical protein